VPRLDPVGLALVVVLGSLALSAVAAGALSARARRRRSAASLQAIDFVRTSFTSRMVRAEPLEALLREVVEALRDFLSLDAAELWIVEGSQLRLHIADPPREAPPVTLSPGLETVILNARVSGRPWAQTWIPGLLASKPDAWGLRVAPVSHAGKLLAILVTARHHRADRLADEADEILDELAREVGVGLYRAGLDRALQATLEQLRRQAGELQASRARLVAAADAERRRIERNLHDGIQQYLLSVSVKARLVERVGTSDREATNKLLGELVDEIQSALVELRALGHGIYPPLLSSSGLRDALSAACRRVTPPAELEADGLGRYPVEVESAVYFCCVEALQNAAKHAGPVARVSLSLREIGKRLQFEISDSGPGFQVGQGAGAGLANMRDRLGAVGGSLAIESSPARGTVVRGEVPLPAS